VRIVQIELSQEMLQVLDAALQQLPYRVAAPVIGEINRQLRRQMATDTPLAGIAKTMLPAELNGSAELQMTSFP